MGAHESRMYQLPSTPKKSMKQHFRGSLVKVKKQFSTESRTKKDLPRDIIIPPEEVMEPISPKIEDQKPPDFTREERDLVRESWVIVENHISQIGLSTYLELFEKNPEALHLFPFLKHLSKEDLEFYSQLKHHAIRVSGVLTMLVRQLDYPIEEADAKISEFLLDLGRRHFSYGSRPHQMELLGHLFIDSFIFIFGDDPRKENIEKSWQSFFGFIVYWMRSGFNFVQSKGAMSVSSS